jgi:hypothetical protein
MAREMHGSLNVSVPQLKVYADTVARLACDARMRWVWRELQKKHRSGQKRGNDLAIVVSGFGRPIKDHGGLALVHETRWPWASETTGQN